MQKNARGFLPFLSRYSPFSQDRTRLSLLGLFYFHDVPTIDSLAQASLVFYRGNSQASLNKTQITPPKNRIFVPVHVLRSAKSLYPDLQLQVKLPAVL